MIHDHSSAPSFVTLILMVALAGSCVAADAPPTPALLDLPGTPADPARIDYASFRVLHGKHHIVSPTDPVLKFQLHSYLVRHADRYWCLWSQGPPVEDEPSQEVRFSTSRDGENWQPARSLTGPPAEGYAYIARGFWLRDGELLALVAHFKGKGAFGVDKELKLQAWQWHADDERWRLKGIVYENAINNFPPQRLSSGPWMMTRRDSRFNVSMLVGGINGFDAWESIPVIDRAWAQKEAGLNPDEPIWWELPDRRLVALFRDNGGSGRLFRAFSSEQGRTWTVPEKTNFPNATSKAFSLQTSQGTRVLVSNANPGVGRRELHLSVSRDGLTFQRIARLAIPSPRPSTLQYPHVVEHDEHLWIVYSRNKAAIELFQVSLEDVEALLP